MENTTDVHENWIINQASTFLSFKIGKILKDIFPFIEPQSRQHWHSSIASDEKLSFLINLIIRK